MNTEKITFYSLLFFIFGVGATSFLSIPLFVYIPLFLLVLIVLLLIRSNKQIWLALFIILFFTLGVLRYRASIPDINENHIGFYNDSEIIFQGRITKGPDERTDKTKLTLGNIRFNEQDLKGKVLINVPLYSDYQYGDLVEVECKLQEPGLIGKFDYHEYLARYDIYSTCYWPKVKVLDKGGGSGTYRIILLVKNRTKDLIDSQFSEPQGSFISALVLGLKRQVPQEMRQWFALSGTSHLLAVSGLHISILTKLIMIFIVTTLLIRRQHAFWLVAILIGLFVVLAGAPASAVRAGIMGLVLLYAEKLGRPHSGTRLIFFTAVIMLLINPKLLKSDIGFQLSFAAVLGLNYFSQVFNQYFKKVPNFRFLPVRQYLSATLSAQISVLPLILYYFGNLSLIAPLANILILSVIPLVMILGFLFAITGFIHIWMGQVLLWPLWILLTYIILVAKIGASIPYVSFVLSSFPLIAVIILYAFIILWIRHIKKNETKTV